MLGNRCMPYQRLKSTVQLTSNRTFTIWKNNDDETKGSGHKSVLHVPESSYVRAVIYWTQIHHSWQVVPTTLADDADTFAVNTRLRCPFLTITCKLRFVTNKYHHSTKTSAHILNLIRPKYPSKFEFYNFTRHHDNERRYIIRNVRIRILILRKRCDQLHHSLQGVSLMQIVPQYSNICCG